MRRVVCHAGELHTEAVAEAGHLVRLSHTAYSIDGDNLPRAGVEAVQRPRVCGGTQGNHDVVAERLRADRACGARRGVNTVNNTQLRDKETDSKKVCSLML